MAIYVFDYYTPITLKQKARYNFRILDWTLFIGLYGPEIYLEIL